MSLENAELIVRPHAGVPSEVPAKQSATGAIGMSASAGFGLRRVATLLAACSVLLHSVIRVYGTKYQEGARTWIRNSLVGTWRLVSREQRDADGRVMPVGTDLRGILTYSADGYMCVAIMQADRPSFANPTRADVTDDEWVAAAREHTSYAGPYEIVEAEGKLLHHVEISLIPNWIGGTQERIYTLKDDRLTLSPGGGATLTWERVGSSE